MSHAYRVLRISFETREDLDREYEANLVNGGLFIPGQLELLYGEPVLVFVDLPFATNSVELEGRVVQSTPVEFEANGGHSGVAIELCSTTAEVRKTLEKAISSRFADERSRAPGNRYAERSVAHVRARVRAPGGHSIEGRTRNLSLAGVLVAISDEAPPVGQEVSVAIVHPTSGEERMIPGWVVRHALDETGEVRGIGIQFNVDPTREGEMLNYLGHVKASEHARRLGGITGSIDTLGLNDLLMSFGQCVPRGRFTLMRGGDVGTVHVESGLMMSAQVGNAIGVKALVRMAAWQDGSFEFQANRGVGEQSGTGQPMSIPIEAALLEAARLIDESRSQGTSGLPRAAALTLDASAAELDDPDRSKLEAEILELAGAGITVGRLLDTIQESDGSIERSLLELVECGLIYLEARSAAS